MTKDLGKTSIGLEPNVAALLSYLAGFITGIIFFAIEKENKFVRFHALQSILVSGGIYMLQIFFSFIHFMSFMPPILNIVGLILWVILMIKAYQGETFKLPIVGNFAEQKA